MFILTGLKPEHQVFNIFFFYKLNQNIQLSINSSKARALLEGKVQEIMETKQ